MNPGVIDKAKLKLKEIFNQSVNEMEKIFNDCEYILSHQENHLDDYILDIKNKIDIQREEEIQDVVKVSNQMMQTLDEYFKKCIDNLPNLKETSEKTKLILSKSRSKLNEKKTELELSHMNDSEIKLSVKEIRKNTIKYNQHKETYENELRMYSNYSFNPINFESFRDIFGELEIKNLNLKPTKLEFKLVRSFVEPSNEGFMRVVDLFDEKRLAVVNGKKHLLIFNLQTTECLQQINLNDSADITCLKWINKSKLILGFKDNLIKVLDLDNNGQCSNTLYGHTKMIQSMCFNLEKNHLISYAPRDNIKIWDLTSNDCIINIPNEHENLNYIVGGMLINSKGNLITFCNKKYKINIFNSDDNYVCEFEFEYSHYAKVMQLTPDENICLLCEEIEIYDCKTGNRLSRINIFDPLERETDCAEIETVNFISRSVIFIISFDELNFTRSHLFDLNNNKIIETYNMSTLDWFIPIIFLKNGNLVVLQHVLESHHERFCQIKIIKTIA